MKSISVICLSPERFLKKKGQHLLSQPIKGTAPRSADTGTDRELASQLFHSEKEKAENVMIADLVRNDLSRFAQAGSVYTKEVACVYSFRYVHQMISSIESKLRPEAKGLEALAACFPPGSMTGAPKIRTMQIIETQENFARGIYSGSIGYVSPEGDYDFNVVIRSLILDTEKQKLMLAAGGAITIQSDPHQEFDETNLKAQFLLRHLGADTTEGYHA